MPLPKPIADWTPENVTPRDVISQPDAGVTVWCEGCRSNTVFNVFRIGAVLADFPLQRLRLRCRRCGVYAFTMELSHGTGGAIRKLFQIQLKPSWDDGKEEAQAAAFRRLERARARLAGAAGPGRDANPAPSDRT